MLKSAGNSLILRGVLALGVGVVALAWPGVTVLSLVILFAVYAFMAAGVHVVTAFSSKSAKPVIGHLLLGALDFGAGLIALAWPGVTALVLVLLVASWAIVTGTIETAMGFQRGEAAGTRARFIIAGLASVAFGVVLFARPTIGAVTLALLFGLYNLIAGTSMVIEGIEVRAAEKTIKSVGERVQSKAHATV